MPNKVAKYFISIFHLGGRYFQHQQMKKIREYVNQLPKVIQLRK